MNTMKTKYIFLIMVIVGLSSISIPIVVYSTTTTTTISVDDSGRREYTYCPINDTMAKGLNAEINGCPLMRVYINDWNRLTPLQQTSIDSQMRALGFVDAGEHVIR